MLTEPKITKSNEIDTFHVMKEPQTYKKPHNFQKNFKTCTHEKIQGETAFTVTVKLVNGKDVLLP